MLMAKDESARKAEKHYDSCDCSLQEPAEHGGNISFVSTAKELDSVGFERTSGREDSEVVSSHSYSRQDLSIKLPDPLAGTKSRLE